MQSHVNPLSLLRQEISLLTKLPCHLLCLILAFQSVILLSALELKSAMCYLFISFPTFFFFFNFNSPGAQKIFFPALLKPLTFGKAAPVPSVLILIHLFNPSGTEVVQRSPLLLLSPHLSEPTVRQSPHGAVRLLVQWSILAINLSIQREQHTHKKCG